MVVKSFKTGQGMKVFRLASQKFNSKKSAQTYAGQYKRRGHFIRITESNGKYLVWTHRNR